MKHTKLSIRLLLGILSSTALILSAEAWAAQPVLANIELVDALGLPVVKKRADLGVALVFASDEDMERMSAISHEHGRCGGFELVPDVVAQAQGAMVVLSTKQIDKLFASIEKADVKFNGPRLHTMPMPMLEFDPAVDMAVQMIDPDELMSGIEWLQGFGGRYHASSQPNRHVEALTQHLQQIGEYYGVPYDVFVIDHVNTGQHSVVFRLTGTERPLETVVLGGHLDSINQQIFADRNNAPGADDNASGSASLIEALKAMLALGVQPKRTVEFMWYAAEEVGLVGSAEIADQYAREGRDVVGVLQLDMTMVPGSGEFNIASMSDFTSAWLRDLLLEMNSLYIHANIVDSRCGYGCSDHASWYRRGYPTLFPHEARMTDLNRKIHTPQDVIDNRVSAEHAAKFAQIGVAFALILGNSELRHP